MFSRHINYLLARWQVGSEQQAGHEAQRIPQLQGLMMSTPVEVIEVEMDGRTQKVRPSISTLLSRLPEPILVGQVLAGLDAVGQLVDDP